MSRRQGQGKTVTLKWYYFTPVKAGRFQLLINVLLIRIFKNHISVILKMVQKFKEINGHSNGSKNKTKTPSFILYSCSISSLFKSHKIITF